MSKLKLAPEITRLIKENYPVVKKRTALWFFQNEMRNKEASSLKEVGEAQASGNKLKPQKMSRIKLFNLWRKMDPESKRIYFNMSEFDGVRYREQKSQWISEVSALLMHHKGTLKSFDGSIPNHEQLQKNFLASLERLHKDYEQMIQVESTKELYKNAIKKADRHDCTDTDKLISSIPKSQRAILERPRRPPCSYILYVVDNIDKFTALKKELKCQDTVMQLGAKEWTTLDRETKSKYEEKYERLKDEYTKAMEVFNKNLNQNKDSLQQATREKARFKRSLRKRLRNSAVLPLSIRNAFNFFLMDHKDIPLVELTEIWRTLPDDKKIKYVKKNQEDIVRYQHERENYNEITRILNELISHRRSSKLSNETDDDNLDDSGDDESEDDDTDETSQSCEEKN